MAQPRTTLTFHIHLGDAPVRTEVLTQDIVKIGKLPSSHLRIDDENVSRMHAVIEVDANGDVHVIDLGSAAGTIVNGKKVNKARLASGDELTIGSARMTLELAAPVAEAAPEPVRAAAPRSPLPPLPNPFAASPVLPNPFAVPSNTPVPAVSHDEPAGEIEYGIAASGPAINPADVETMASAAEVVILWGDRSVLHVAHLSPPRAFTIGEPGGGATPDFVVDGLALGGDRLPLTVESGGNVAVVVPSGATGDVRVGEDVQTIEQLKAAGRLTACSALAGAEQYVLPQGAVATIRFHGFTFVTKATSAGRRVGTEIETSFRAQLWTGISLAVHAAFLMMFYFMPPTASALSLDLVRPDDRLVQYLMTPPETVDDPPPDWLEQQASTETEGGTGQAHEGPSGAMGDEHNEHTQHHYGIQGESTDPQMAREHQEQQARDVASALGSLLQQVGSFGPTSPYGADQARGADRMDALGALMGDQTGANFGFGGLGPSGTGRGGGGFGLGTIGVGRLGTIGHGAGTGPGNGYGDGVGGFHGRRDRPPPHITTGEAEVHGSLSREVIRRTIRRHINEVRFCYEQQLATRPDLAGRVTVSFIISSTGAVQTSGLLSSTLNNSAAESCIVSSVRRWTFPAPDGGGVVGVNYPFVLDSAGAPGE